MFSKWKLRYLEDPKQTLGGAETVYKLARKGFDQEQPEAYAFLKRYEVPLADVEKIMFDAQSSDLDKAIDAYIAANPQKVEFWTTGKGAS